MNSCKDISLLVIKDQHVSGMNGKTNIRNERGKAYKWSAYTKHAVYSWWSW